MTTINPDLGLEVIETLSPATGILDITGHTAVLRHGGYLPGPGDVHVPNNLIREHGLRRGDDIAGLAQPNAKGGKLAPLIRVDTVNGRPVAEAKSRPRYADLTPIHPDERLRLETTANKLTTRVTDLIMPIGKGQRALIVAPPKAGKTSVLQAIAHGIAANHPEAHLMLVLIGERPEEVTEFTRGVPGEVIAATFDHSPAQQTALAELAIERAQRLVEEGRDVVVLLDSLTRLARAYNTSGPASGRIMSGAWMPPHCCRPRSSWVRPAISSTADRSPLSPPHWSRPVRSRIRSSSRSTRAPAMPSSNSTAVSQAATFTRPSISPGPAPAETICCTPPPNTRL